jgi:hypothetical protein
MVPICFQVWKDDARHKHVSKTTPAQQTGASQRSKPALLSNPGKLPDDILILTPCIPVP